MLNSIPHYSHISEEEYYAFEERAEIRHEYYKGEIFGMAGGSPEHAQLAANIITSLGGRLRGQPCYPTTSDQRVKIEATGLITYPDTAVVCPPLRRDPKNLNTLLNPRVVVEVLSESTEEYDHSVKLDHYLQVDSLTHCILVSQDRIRVEHYHRETGGEWEREEYVTRDSILTLTDLEITMPLAEIYERFDGLPEGAVR